ncbi:spore coat protein [Sporomusa acidovorans]|uniref:Coat F domain protein n=1 Tax=Sporomusa acidovorans (strain ATCC 49682 / DSM 3132 / Mol) TaxID=1123286 RepID=A0ABZ3IY96_SPOA4|nr:spore coat protein [Sporomusa acidovorans]OZC17688.1 coat F domain protein [Sporomusa acidovorans DSM 3132]SDE12109.1 Coat F domain-containing protein [Sporomusa acidovorans]
MNDKDMLNDYLAMIKGSLATYANVIAETGNSQLRSTFQQMRNQDEQRQYQIAQTAQQKGYYKPAAPATSNDIQQVKSELMSLSM